MQIFLSYARSDGAPQAEALYRYLLDRGHSPFLDVAGLSAGRSWSVGLEDEINNCEVLIALMSPGAFASDICRAEQLRGLRVGKRVIPVRLSGLDVMPLFLETRQWIEFDCGRIAAALETGLSDAVLSRAYSETFVTRPCLPPGLVQREQDLEKLRHALVRERPNRRIAIVALRAQGGIGKSVLANMIFDDPTVQAAYPHGLLWIQLGQHVSDAQVLERLHEALRILNPSLDLQRYNTLTAASNQFRTLLQTRHALIVIDDLWDARQLRHFIFHEAGNATVLVTTRDEDIVRGTRAFAINLDKLDKVLSEQLLKERSGWTEDLPAEGHELLKLCDGLPLALAMTGAQLFNAPRKKWSYLVDRLKKSDLRAVAITLPDYEKHGSLYEAIHAAVEDIEPQDRERYLEIALFPDDTAIPEAVFETLWDSDPFPTLDVWSRLSMATRDSEQRVTFHDLQIAYARSRQPRLSELHTLLIDRYGKRCGGIWHNLPADGYIHSWLPWHFARAGRTGELRELLLDTRWLASKLREHSDPASLIADFDFFPRDEKIQSIADAIRLSSHILARDPTQLVSQLAGRVEITERILESGSKAILVPVYKSLTKPGEGLVGTIDTQDSPVSALVSCEGGKLALCGFGSNRLALWHLTSGRKLREFEGFTSTVSALAVSSTRSYAVGGSSFGELRLFDWSTNESIDLAGHIHPVTAVAINEDDTRIVSVAPTDEELKVWDVKSGKLLEIIGGYGSGMRVFALESTARNFISVSHSDLEWWTLSPLKKIKVFQGLGARLQRCVIGNESRLLLCSYSDGMLLLIDLESGIQIKKFEANAIEIALMPKWILGSSQTTLFAWSISTASQAVFQGQGSRIRSLHPHPNGRLALAGATDGTVKIWNLEEPPQPVAPRAKRPVQLHTTEDGTVAISIAEEGEVEVWNLKNGQARQAGKMPMSMMGDDSAIELGFEGQRIVQQGYLHWEIGSGRSFPVYEYSDNALVSRNGEYWAEVSKERVKVGCKYLDNLLGEWTAGIEAWDSITVSRDRRQAIMMASDRIELREIVSGRILASATDSEASPFSEACFLGDDTVALFGNGAVWRLDGGGLSHLAPRVRESGFGAMGYDTILLTAVVTGSGSVDLQDAAGGTRLASFTADNRILCCALTKDAKTLICGDASGRIHILRVVR